MMKRPADVLRDIFYAAPKASQIEHRNAMWEEISDDIKMLEAIYDEWFAGRYPYYKALQQGSSTIVTHAQNNKAPVKNDGSPHSAPRRIDYPAQRRAAEAKAKRLKATAETIAAAFRQRCLLDWLLPDGTPLRDATASQCRRAGGWLNLVAKKMKGGIVGNQFSNDDLHNLWSQAS